MRLSGVVALAALVAALGCGDLFPADPTVEVSLSVESSVASAYRLSANIDGKRVELSADPESTSRVTTRVPATGSLPVHLVVRSAAGDSLAGFSFQQNFRRESNQWVAVVVGIEPPLGSCVNPASLPRAALAGGDSAFVDAGSISKGAVC